jgi:ribonucleotide monophosphatase NagD (HAD superfamily)
MGIKAVLLDIDGVLTIRDRLIEGAPQTLLKASREFLLNNKKNKANAYLLVSDMAREEFYGKIQGKRP